jgi:hypothetical protein
MCVRPHSTDIETDILAETFDNVSKVHTRMLISGERAREEFVADLSDSNTKQR